MKLNDLPKNNSKILHAFLKRPSYDGVIVINTYVKNQIAEEFGVRQQTVSNAITKLIKADIMQRVGLGAFMLNPNLFAKGKWTDVRKLQRDYVELKVKINNDGSKSITGTLIES